MLNNIIHSRLSPIEEETFSELCSNSSFIEQNNDICKNMHLTFLKIINHIYNFFDSCTKADYSDDVKDNDIPFT